jgi:beta-1,4-mannosyltransferase
MNVVMISRVGMNPYVHLLGNALQQVEPGLTCAYDESLSPETVTRWRGQASVFHLHWAEVLYRSSSHLRTARKLARFLLAIRQAHSAGIRLVYTAHNVAYHDDAGTLLDALGSGVIYRQADAVHVHDEEAKRELLKHRQPKLVEVIAHGNYIGAYADTCTRESARQRLGIDSGKFVLLALGQIRPYKGLDDLIAAFRCRPGDDVRLVIAGHPHDPAYGEALQRAAAGDGRIGLHLGFVPDEEIQYYMRAADFCVLPYRSGTTSGAAILAFSFGVPVIAPDVWPFRPLLTGGSGLLYSADGGGLRQALAGAQDMDHAQASAAALALARSLDWQPIARKHLEVYKKIC